MVDLFALVVSLGMLAVVIFFAMRLNKSMPWFERPQPRDKRQERPAAPPTAPRQPVRQARFLGRR
jgi:hypothetical protein